MHVRSHMMSLKARIHWSCAVTMAVKKRVLELDKLIEDFCSWQKATTQVMRENEVLQKELKNAQKRSIIDQEAVQANSDEIFQLRTTVDKLHGIFSHRCDLEEENAALKEEIKSLKISSAQLEKTRSCQMAEALENLQILSKTHKEELISNQNAAHLKWKQELDAKEREIQDKVAEVKLLQQEKAEVERTRHTDIVKLRLEYDAKMLKLQKQQQSTRTQPVQSSSASNEIFRKKLQHMKAESEKEITTLKRKVEELERKLQSGTRVSKRTRLM